MPVSSLTTHFPDTLTLVAGYGTGRKLSEASWDAASLNVMCVVWVLMMDLLVWVCPWGLGRVPDAGPSALRCGLSRHWVVVSRDSTYICRYWGSGSVVV